MATESSVRYMATDIKCQVQLVLWFSPLRESVHNCIRQECSPRHDCIDTLFKVR